jgi:hypothetical protein
MTVLNIIDSIEKEIIINNAYLVVTIRNCKFLKKIIIKNNTVNILQVYNCPVLRCILHPHVIYSYFITDGCPFLKYTPSIMENVYINNNYPFIHMKWRNNALRKILNRRKEHIVNALKPYLIPDLSKIVSEYCRWM